ncbi:SDR family NAD(P)-dependent oxidoreductase [Streptomyces sp. SS7]|uniref:SDR family NAD(P)-dependent oxidoreductase n=1 Tax=Streptomyces sp. SS7 TaxID=3108485 RepID=UPI0030EE6C05
MEADREATGASGRRPVPPGELRAVLRQLITDACGVPEEEIDDLRPLVDYGLTSRAAVSVAGRLEHVLDVSLPATLLWETRTIEQLVRRLGAVEDVSWEERREDERQSQGRDPLALAAAVADDGGSPGGPSREAHPVAVIGLGCRLPGGVSGPEAFWKQLVAGRDFVGAVPATRRRAFGSGALFGTSVEEVVGEGSFLDDVEAFDADYFGITPREAEVMDPQQRLLLEVACEALDHAGRPAHCVEGSDTGVFVGLSALEYGHLTTADPLRLTPWTSTGAAGSIAANRLSYLLDLHGPSVTVDTACSSSLVAVHQACVSLSRGECDTALAAGTNVLLLPAVTASFEQAGALAADRRCKPFDAAADGITRGEGCAVVVLRRLADAQRDGDRILAVIKGTAVNSDGRSAGLMAPNPAAQEDLLRRALGRARVDAGSIDYVETHGTGTLLGDPMEAGALGAVMGRGRPAGQPLLIGSVKSNLGHLEGAAGIVGLMKTVLALHHRRIPQNLHFRTPNPHIDFTGLRLRVVSAPTAWPEREGHPPRAGVSAFGFGGTNAHAVLEAAPAAPCAVSAEAEDVTAGSRSPHVLVVSSRSGHRIADAAAGLARLAASDHAPPLRDLAHTLALHRRGHTCAAVTARTHEEAARLLAAVARGEDGPGIVAPCTDRPAVRASESRRPVFVFSGHGSQWRGMGWRLLQEDALFDAAVRDLDPVYAEATGHSLRSLLDGSSGAGVDHVQPLLFGMHLALARTLEAYGVHPAAVIGHSVGEVSAAVAAGALSAADGLLVVLRRSAQLAAVDTGGAGAMAAVELDVEERASVLVRFPGVEIAVHSSPRRCTVTGPAQGVRRLVDELAAEGRLARLLDVGGAGHSPAVDAVVPALREALGALRPGRAEVPWYTTVLDDPRATVHADADYWCANVRRPVRLQQAVDAAVADGLDLFVEVSPHPIAVVAVRETVEAARGASHAVVVPTLDRRGDEPVDLRTALTRLHFAGAGADESRLWPAGARVALPSPAWRHGRYWFGRGGAAGPRGVSGRSLLGVRTDDPRTDAVLWQTDLGACGMHAFERPLHGQPVLNLAAAAALVTAAAVEVQGHDAVTDLCLDDLVVEAWLPLGTSTPVTVVWEPAGERAAVTVNARAADGSWRCHASAQVDTRPPAARGDVLGADAPPVVVGRWAPAETEAAAVAGEGVVPGYEALLTALLYAPAQGGADTAPGAPLGAASPHTVPVAVRRLRIRHLTAAEPVTIEAFPAAPGPGRAGSGPDADPVWDVVARGTRTCITARGVELRSPGPGEIRRPLEALSYDIQWQKSAVPLPEELGSVLLLADGPAAGDGDGGVAALGAALRGKGVRTAVCASSSADTARCLEDWLERTGQDGRRAAVLLLTGPPAGAGDARALHTAVRIARRLVSGVPGGRQPRLWIVTERARAVNPGETGEPNLACLRGLVRALALEHPTLRASLVDLDGSLGSGEELLQELLGNSPEDEVVWRTGSRLVARLAPAELTAQQYEIPFVRRKGAYIVTGGLTGLGLATARRLAGQGAGRLVLNGRRPPAPQAQEVIGELLAHGTSVAVVRGDIADPGVAPRLVEAALGEGHELRGVAHCAGLLHDRMLTDVEADDIDTVLRPKVTGALRLEEALDGHDIDWLVFYSSAAALLGSPGQSAYAAANAWLDAMAQRRRAEGKPAVSIGWGPWSETGGVRAGRAMALRSLTMSEGLDALQTLVVHHRTHTGVAHFDTERVLGAFPGVSDIPFFADCFQDGGAPADDWVGPDGIGALGDGAAGKVYQRLVERTATLMGLGAADIDRSVPLPELGLDSLMAVRVRNAARQDFAIDLPPDLMLRGASLEEIGEAVLERLGLERDGGQPPGAPAKETVQEASAPSLPVLPSSIQPRDAAERLVAGAWAEVLGTRPADVFTDFASAGGDRRWAGSLLEAIRGRLAGAPLDLTAESLFAARTPAGMAELIRPAVNPAGRSPVTVLRPPCAGSGGRPLFTFHPAGGPTSVYRPLTQLLPSDQAVYGMERLDGVDTMEEKAAHYVRLIRELQPAGPYRLLGWSFGGCLAYESARQLAEAGEQVGFLGLIDTILPAALPDLDSEEMLLERFGRFAEYIEKTYGRKLQLPYDELAATPDERQIDVVMRLVAEVGLDMSPGIMEHQRTSYIDARVGERYTPRPTDAHVVLYRAQQAQPLTTALDPRYLRSEADLGWAPLCPSLEIVPVEGDHLSLIDPPHVAAIARHLVRRLAGAAGRGE